MIIANIQPPPPVTVRHRKSHRATSGVAPEPKRSETFRRLAGKFRVKGAPGRNTRIKDIFWFSNGGWAECGPLPLADAEELWRLDKLDLDDTCDYSPPLREWLAFAQRHRAEGGQAWFVGCRVGPMRADARIQIDGMLLSLPLTGDEERLLKAWHPDEWDEYEPDERPDGPQVPYLRVWWD
jgi:hypothetical protein